MNKSTISAFFIGCILTFVIMLTFQKPNTPEFITKTEPANCPKAEALACVQKPEEPIHYDILPPPKLDANFDGEVETNKKDGEVKIKWNSIPKAASYMIKLYDQKGGMVRSWKVSRNVIYLKNVPFDAELAVTNYNFTISTINGGGAAGAESKKYVMRSNRISKLLAPTIESITVEE